VAIYKADFEAERKSREELNDRCLELEEKFRLLERQFVEKGFNPPNNPLPLPVINPVNQFPVAIDPEVSSVSSTVITVIIIIKCNLLFHSTLFKSMHVSRRLHCKLSSMLFALLLFCLSIASLFFIL